MSGFIKLIKEDIMNGFLPKISQTKFNRLSKHIFYRRMQEIEDLELDQLYVHIPFCPSRCSFCSFFIGKINPGSDELEYYVGCLLEEIKTYSRILEGKIRAKKVKTIYFGGGTPSILNNNQFTEIIETLISCFRLAFADKVEITIEMRPEDYIKMLELYNQLNTKLLKQGFFIRFSVGVQSIDSKILNSVGRGQHPFNIIEQLVLEFRKQQVLFNFDLMYLLPCQNKDSTLETAQYFVDWQVPQISVYRTKYVEGTPIYNIKHMASMDMDEEIRNELYNTFIKNGYKTDDDQFFYKDTKFEQAKLLLGFGAGAFSDTSFFNKMNATSMEKYYKLINNKSVPLRSFRFLGEKENTFDKLKIKIFKLQKFDEKELRTLLSNEKINKLENLHLIRKDSSTYGGPSGHKEIRWLIYKLMPVRDKISLIYLVVKRRLIKKFTGKDKVMGSGLEPPLSIGGLFFDIVRIVFGKG